MYDAIVIPGGGLLPDGTLPPWAVARFERALAVWSGPLAGGEVFLPLSAGTTHRPLALGPQGQPRFEAHAGASWLLARGVPESLILPEPVSYDTIGNALFARLLHAGPRRLRRLHVITSAFHLPRCQAIFDWVFSLPSSEYELTYEATEDVGLSKDVLAARQEKEAAGVQGVAVLRSQITTLEELHRWLYTHHDAYRASRPAWHQKAADPWLDSY